VTRELWNADFGLRILERVFINPQSEIRIPQSNVLSPVTAFKGGQVEVNGLLF
jgi:hypothetical protein